MTATFAGLKATLGVTILAPILAHFEDALASVCGTTLVKKPAFRLSRCR